MCIRDRRKRWEHGHFAVIARMPSVMLKAIASLNYRLFMQALDAAIPPTVMWILVLMMVTLITAIASIWMSAMWFYLMLSSFILFGVSLIISWWRYGRDILSPTQLKGIPLFVLSKFGIYSSFITNRQKKWVRTKRDD